MIAMVFADRCSSANHRQHHEEQPRHFQPEYVEYASNVAQGHVARVVEGADPAIFAGLSPSNTQEGSTLSTKIAG